MKPRLTALALFALVLFSWDASAQTRSGSRRQPAPEHTVPNFGSVARNKLLRQALGPEDLRLGSTERRGLLTGKTVQQPRPPKHRTTRRR